MQLSKLVEEKPFRNAVIIILAGLTFVTSLMVFLNVSALYRGAAAGRDSRVLGIRYLTHLGKASWDAAAEKRLMVEWQELGELMKQSEAYEKMSAGKDASLYRLTRERLTKVRDLLAGQGAVTNPPYFNDRIGAPDFSQYFVEKTLIPAAELLERQDIKKREGGFWGSKSDAYTTALAVMAVAVFLLTLSLVITGEIRFWMAGTGLVLVLAVVISAAAATFRTWKAPSEESITLFAKASGDVTRAQAVINTGSDLGAVRFLLGRAESDLQKALSVDLDYQTAVLLLDRVHTLKGETLIYEGKVEEGRTEIARSLEGIERVIAQGREDGYIWWARAGAEMFLGKTKAALGSLAKAQAFLPDRAFALGIFNAIILMMGGERAKSEAAAEAAIAFAAEHPMASDPYDFRGTIKNLERWNEILPMAGGEALVRRLKEAEASIAALKKALPEAIASDAASLRFVTPVEDDQGEVIDYTPSKVFPRSTARAYFLLEFKGMKKDQSIVTKIFWKGPGRVFWVEQVRMGKRQHWKGPEESARLVGTVQQPMPEAGEVLSSGDYRLEIYIDGNLAVSETFKVL